MDKKLVGLTLYGRIGYTGGGELHANILKRMYINYPWKVKKFWIRFVYK
jgi:hypothetical protein